MADDEGKGLTPETPAAAAQPGAPPKEGAGAAPTPEPTPTPKADETLLAQVREAVQRELAEKYEKDVGKLKSASQKREAELRKKLAELQQQQMQATLAQARHDPSALADALPNLVEMGVQERMAYREQQQQWERETLAQFELGDAETEEVEKRLEGVGPDERAWWLLFHAGQVAKEKADTVAKEAQKQAQHTLASVPDLVKREVAAALKASGLQVVDAGEPTTPVQDNPIKDIRNPDVLLAMGLGIPELRKKGGRG